MRRALPGLGIVGMLLVVSCSDAAGPEATPEHVFHQVVAGNGFGCALAEGAAYCWGANDVGQLGRETESERGAVGAVAGGLSFDTIAAGDRNVCGLAGGRAYCWGEGDLLGGEAAMLTPVAVEPTTAVFVSLTVGGRHACALTATGGAWCWGKNDSAGGGQLGNGTVTSSATATAVVGGIAFDELSAGFLHTCGRTGDEVWCWGSNFGRAAGLTDGGATAEPSAIDVDASAISIEAGALVSCLVAANGVHCWGTNQVGQLGRDTGGESDATPGVAVGSAGLRGVQAGSVNRSVTHVCALSDTARPICWGANDQGQLGRSTGETCMVSGTDVPCATAPGGTDTELEFVSLAVGGDHTCGLADGSVYCWGANDRGQLGGSSGGGATPVPIEVGAS